MTLQSVMLGLLSLKPRTGYDLKKEIANSRFLHWSGNSNQIYRALLELSDRQMVTVEVVHQEKGPTKKVFTISAYGRERLRQWLTAEVEPPELRSGFIMRLLFAGALDHGETEAMMLAYEEVLRVRLRVAEEERDRRAAGETGSRAAYLSAAVDDFAVRQIETEIAWLRQIRSRLPV